MAFQAEGYALSVSVSDTSGSISTLEYDLQAVDMATAETDATTIIGLLEDVTDSELIGYSVRHKYFEDTIALPADAENAIKASVTVQLKDTSAKANFRIPAPKDAIFTSATGSGYNVVDTDNTEVQAYAGMFLSTAQATIARGQFIATLPTSVLAGKRVSVRSSNP